MIDTIKLTSRKHNLNNFKVDKECKSTITYPEIKHKNKRKIVSKRYLFKNLTINISTNQLTINGSLTKYFLGHNINFSLGSIKDLSDAFDKLSEDLEVDLYDFSINRLDFGRCFVLPNPVRDYLSSLKVLNKHKSIRFQGTGIDFINSYRTIIFYDKIAIIKSSLKEKRELGLKTLKILDVLDKNVLRYEIQLKIPQKKSFTVKQLIDKSFYNNKILAKYYDYYKDIEKDNVINIDFSNKKPGKLLNMFALYGVQCYGRDKVDTEVSNARKVYPNKRRNYYNLQKRIRELSEKYSFQEPNLDDLTRRISEAKDMAYMFPDSNLIIDDDAHLYTFLVELVKEEKLKDPELKLTGLSLKWDIVSTNWRYDNDSESDVAFKILLRIREHKEKATIEDQLKRVTQEDCRKEAIHMMKQIKHGSLLKMNLIQFLNQIADNCL